jgi:hypothetical protein
VNLGALLLDLCRRLNYQDVPAAAVTARLTAFINQRHRQILAMPGMDQLRDESITFQTVANQPTYAMGPAVSRIKTIYDSVTNQIKLEEQTLQWLRAIDPRLASFGPPGYWVPLSIKQTQAQPATTGLWAVSSSASDTQNVFLETTRTGGYSHVAPATTLTGVTRVQIGTLTDHVSVDKFYLATPAAGTVSLYDAVVSGNLLATIPIGATYARYLWIQLWPTPAGVYTYSVDYTREIHDMVNPSDQPLLPPDFHSLLSVGARLDEYEKLDDSRRSLMQDQWDKGIKRLQHYVLNSGDLVIIPGERSRAGRSNLGPNFPAGVW